jgi:hypothetical protein
MPGALQLPEGEDSEHASCNGHSCFEEQEWDEGKSHPMGGVQVQVIAEAPRS